MCVKHMKSLRTVELPILSAYSQHVQARLAHAPHEHWGWSTAGYWIHQGVRQINQLAEAMASMHAHAHTQLSATMLQQCLSQKLLLCQHTDLNDPQPDAVRSMIIAPEQGSRFYVVVPGPVLVNSDAVWTTQHDNTMCSWESATV